MRLPVSTSTVAMMVKLPPSSSFRAAPKKRLGCTGRWGQDHQRGCVRWVPHPGYRRGSNVSDCPAESPRLVLPPPGVWLAPAPSRRDECEHELAHQMWN